jgi:hypothetical protein
MVALMTKTTEQLLKDYPEKDFVKNFQKIFDIRWFFLKGLRCKDYIPSEAFEDAISLTPYGETFAEFLRTKDRDLNESEISFILFAHLYHEDLIIDIFNTNVEEIEKALDNQIIEGNLIYPWISDTILYDKYYHNFEGELKALSFEESLKLLRDTPNGVYQAGEYLIGPFGLLKSSCKRMFLPTLNIPIRSCSNPVCDSVHKIIISQNEDNRLMKAWNMVKDKMRDSGIESSHWSGYAFDHLKDDEDYAYYDDMKLREFPNFLVGAFNLAEFKLILMHLIDTHSKEIRSLFPKRSKFRGLFEGNSDYITNNLDKNHCLQLILLLNDSKIVNTIESLIDKTIIEIPATEKRISKIPLSEKYGWIDTNIECSRNGIRTIEGSGTLALARLKRLIKEIYNNKDNEELLDWKLSNSEGRSLLERLDKCIYYSDPELILSDLIMDSPLHLKATFKLMKYGNFTIPRTSEDKIKIIKKLLWKIGFNIYLYPEYINLFWDRYAKFISLLGSDECQEYDERKMELIRSSAVNFFVSLEQILGYSLSFSTWALLSDHYLDTHYKLNIDIAQSFMASKLTGNGEGKLTFDPSGKNTFYPLIMGFSCLSNICANMMKNKQIYERPESEIQKPYKRTSIEVFPFLHKALILDLPNQDQEEVLDLLKEVTTSLSRANVCNIRNRIEHSREKKEFPSRDEIERMCEVICNKVKDLISFGLCPSVFWNTERYKDKYNRLFIKCKDCNNREITLITSPQHNYCRFPDFSRPLVIVPGMHIGDSGELMRFHFEETSSYTEMWKDFPRKRPAPKEIPSEEILHVE